jgi:hypothetical protein
MEWGIVMKTNKRSIIGISDSVKSINDRTFEGYKFAEILVGKASVNSFHHLEIYEEVFS